jgi:hypothetical protein
MISLRWVGNFKEFPHTDRKGPSLKECLSDTPHEDEQHIIHYLDHGVVLAASAGIAYDVLSDQRKVIGTPHIMTDGEWTWSAVLSYYVRYYHCRLPDEFIHHMRSKQWSPPSKDMIDMRELSEHFWRSAT